MRTATLAKCLLTAAAVTAQNINATGTNNGTVQVSTALPPLKTTTPEQCQCGFWDPSTNQLYTESLVVYFNETTAIDAQDFKILDYHHHKEKGWNTIYRQGASPGNVAIGNEGALPWQDAIDGNETSLELWIDPSNHHLVNGAELDSLRQDIMFGTFRASLRSAQPWIGGSALTMALKFNDSSELELDMLNGDVPTNARIMQIINGEYPDNTLATNYSLIENANSPGYPWDFIDVRFDWTNDSVDFWIFGNRTRHVTKDDRTLPSVPQLFQLRHWSTGDENFMGGPPINRSVANVRYIRAFFNSSLMTDADHQNFDAACNATAACSIDDITLRGSTSYHPLALAPWKQPKVSSHIRWVAGVVAAAFSTFGVASLINAFIRRTPWHKLKRLGIIDRRQKKKHNKLRESFRQSLSQPVHLNLPDDEKEEAKDGVGRLPSIASGYNTPGTATPLPVYATRANTPGAASPVPEYFGNQGSGSRAPSYHSGTASSSKAVSRSNSVRKEPLIDEADPQGEADAIQSVPMHHSSTLPSQEAGHSEPKVATNVVAVDISTEEANTVISKGATVETVPIDTAFIVPTGQPVDATASSAGATPKAGNNVAPAVQTKRIDYLAGFTAFSCIAVTMRHFSLTFWPYVTEGAGDVEHFAADKNLSYFLGPYLLTPWWIGPFFVTSCRFLAARYLKNGNISDIANKMLLRGPRMLIPVFIFMMLEYFLISLGLTGSLQYLPSITYSTWPYVQPQSNFGVFLNEIVEIAYIIPNAAPEVINHYCVGVLWTIPVQHYFSYVTLMAAVMIRDVKKPWKRFGFYFLAIVAAWYATSWSACHWAGLLLADADITYNWLRWCQARWWALYSVLTIASLVALASPLVLLFNSQIFEYSFMAWENAIHPDPITGQPIFETIKNINDAYPAYYNPSLAVLTFSVSLQVIVEMSTWVQWFLSLPCFTILHPHIMTIYLTHGFVFWSLGSWLVVTLGSAGLTYWAVLLITALICYTVILCVAMILSPLTEFVTQSTMKNIWRWATEEPVPHMATTAPFDKKLIIERGGEAEPVISEKGKQPVFEKSAV